MFRFSFTIKVPSHRMADEEWKRTALSWLRVQLAQIFDRRTLELSDERGTIHIIGYCAAQFPDVARSIYLKAYHGSLVLENEKFEIGAVTIIDEQTGQIIVDHASPTLLYDDVTKALYGMYMRWRVQRKELIIAS